MRLFERKSLCSKFHTILPLFYPVSCPLANFLSSTFLRLQNLLQSTLPLIPVLHHSHSTTLTQQHLLLGLNLLQSLIFIAPHIPNQWNARPLRRSSTTLTILHCHTLLRLDPNNLARMQVHRGIRLTRRLRQARRGTKHPILSKILVHARLLDTRLHTAQRARADHRHAVFALLAHLVEHGHDADARLRLFVELLNDLAQFALDVAVFGGLVEGEVVARLEAFEHAAEVLADEVFEELRARVAIGEVVLFEYLVGELGAGFEGEGFGEDERVVAVEEDVFDLLEESVLAKCRSCWSV